METAVREFQLSLYRDGPRYAPPIKPARKVLEERALSDTGFAAKYQDPALALRRFSQEPVERGAFGLASEES